MSGFAFDRQAFAPLKEAIDTLARDGAFRYDALGQLLAAFSLSSWPPTLFPSAWTLLQLKAKDLVIHGIDAQALPRPPDTSPDTRFLTLHPEEGFALFFAPKKEVAAAIKSTPSWEFVAEPPHWRIYPVRGAGHTVLDIARGFGFQLAEGVADYAHAIDLNPPSLLSRRIACGRGPRDEQEGFDVYFKRSNDVRAQLNDILGRAFVDYPQPHWWVPAEPYQASDLLILALRHQFTIGEEALPKLEQLADQAERLPPKPPIRRIDFDELAHSFWIYCPPDKELNREITDIPGAHFPSKDNPGRGWRIPVTGKALAALSEFIETHQVFVCLPKVQSQLRHQLDHLSHRAQAATAKTAQIRIEGLGGDLRPRQLACVAYAQEVGFRVLIGDEVGVGKTPESLAILHVCDAYPALVLCPANVKYNWEYEVGRWLPGKTIRVLEETTAQAGDYEADVMIVNYDLLHPRLDTMKVAFERRGGLKAIIADESHYLKNREAQRTQAALALAEGVPVRLALTGTPVLNRPVELVSQLEFLGRLDAFGGFWSFVSRYCHARPTGFGGWDFSGKANTEELHQLLKEVCYIRRKKKDVMPELPEIEEELVRVDIDNWKEYQRAEQDTIAWLREQAVQDQVFLASLAGLDETLRKIAISERARSKEERARRALQLARIEALKQVAVHGKLKAMHEWIDTFLAGGEKLVVFAVHIELQQVLLQWYPSAARILGDMGAEARFANVRRFQDDPDCPLIICALKAAKEGVTLTAASHVALLELLWTPADVDQPVGRVHRETQQASSVTLWYLLAAHTIEVTIARLIEEKRKVVDAVSDGTPPDPEQASVFQSLVKVLTQGMATPESL